MILHNFCIKHGFQLEQQVSIEIESHNFTTSGKEIRQSVINEYFN